MIQQELSELKKVLDEKESDVKSLEIKIRELEKLKRDQKREIDKLQVEAQKVQKEYEKAKDKATELFEQNTMLKEEVKTHQSTAIADSQIKDMYEEVKKENEELNKKYQDVLKELQDRDSENENIAVLAQNKSRGFRKTTPASDAEPAPVNPIQEPIDVIDVSKPKNQCDVCAEAFDFPDKLRTHLIEVHGKIGGTMIECRVCKFSALNREHLKLHLKKCENRQKSTPIQKKNKTCRYWKNSSCRRSNCQFKHELLNCKFGSQCYNQNCQFEHPKQQNVYHWINPAFRDKNVYQQSFPFLDQTQCQCPRRNIGK